MPVVTPSGFDLKDAVVIGNESDINGQEAQLLREQLMVLHPWRKGPFELFDLQIDTEWRSDWKWDRVKPHLADLENRLVLDVGCGNGYHCLRMSGAGAKRVVGIDPSAKFIYQFYALKKYLPPIPVDVLPLASEQLPPVGIFDTVFSMGVIYHRREPLEHLCELKSFLRPGGQLVLETLVIDESEGKSLIPEERYAKMRNVRCIPSPSLALDWLAQSGFREARLVDIAITTTGEQRRTEWMQFESLADFLDPNDPARTIEGYPAPRRGIFTATS